MFAIKKIMFPTDFSSYSNQAYFHAVALAETHSATLTIIYVLSPDQQNPEERAKTAAHWLDQLEMIRPLNPHIPTSHLVLEGDPAQEIVKYATQSRMDLIVMGTHGRTGTERQLMGSVAEQVVRYASCSVMVVKMGRAQPITADPILIPNHSKNG